VCADLQGRLADGRDLGEVTPVGGGGVEHLGVVSAGSGGMDDSASRSPARWVAGVRVCALSSTAAA
jgi:hypothetical protein